MHLDRHAMQTMTLAFGFVLTIVSATSAAPSDPVPDGAPEVLAFTPVPPPGIRWLHHVTEPFSILATEVTVAQFRACVSDKKCSREHFKSTCNFEGKGKDAHPMNCVDYFGAEEFCGFVGGRMCKETEWLDACRGADMRLFPYGDDFDLSACNHQSGTRTVPDRPLGTVAAGSLKSCEGGIVGLFDMAGNVSEWVNKCKGTYCKFRGAGYRSNDPVDRFAGCAGVCAGNQKTFSSATVGFRCCRDETP